HNKLKDIDYKVIAMEDINQINEKFDIVISSLAFHYIKDYNKLIKDIYNLLNKDGYLIFSQEHPFTTCIKYTENVQNGHTIIDEKYFGLFSDYNRPGIRTKEWFEKDVIKYHRTFTEIINVLVSNGFSIEKIDEPVASKEAIVKNPKYINQLDRPFFLIVKAKKIMLTAL
uniref:class I SAM-dependent methyltransferase n=1 Tax=uncultured Eubacterium sp. TaxID=165185 RepID=UPI003265F522